MPGWAGIGLYDPPSVHFVSGLVAGNPLRFSAV